ncbi:hypothetical protein SAMN05216225_101176 [Ornithinibacillus halophilus]|uniref:Uncharacterized protein n=1 Tax=Ornithinibacillus halophilus TaxID=930117 RepID=A0A1M5G579_9BACI|nr:hypothetical protein SAMN05216225_101176 [Ornithinibacillus halophilus]
MSLTYKLTLSESIKFLKKLILLTLFIKCFLENMWFDYIH